MHPILKYGNISYSGMLDTYDIVDVQGTGRIKELCIAVPPNGGSITFTIDRTSTTLANTKTSTAFIYYSIQFPSNLNTSSVSESKEIVWFKVNGAGDIDSVNLSSPTVFELGLDTYRDLPSSNTILICNLTFDKKLKITLTSGDSSSTNKPYSVIAEYG